MRACPPARIRRWKPALPAASTCKPLHQARYRFCPEFPRPPTHCQALRLPLSRTAGPRPREKPVPHPQQVHRCPRLLGCRRARSASQRGGEAGVGCLSQQPAAASSPASRWTSPPPKGLPLYQLPPGPCGREAEGRAGRGARSRGQGLGKAGRDKQWAEAGPHHGLARPGHVSRPHLHPHSLARGGPCPYQPSAGRGGPSGQRGSVPGLVSGRSPQQRWRRWQRVSGAGPAQAAAAPHPSPLLWRRREKREEGGRERRRGGEGGDSRREGGRREKC